MNADEVEYHYWGVEGPASVDSLIYLKEALLVVRSGKQLLACFDEHGVETGVDCPPPTNDVFSEFLEALYGAGFVMGDVKDPHFSQGPVGLLFLPVVATVVAQASNLLTVRMFTHTLARGHRMSSGSYGYPYFDAVYKSGGLRAIVERVEQYCNFAQRRKWLHLQDDPELNLIQPVAP